MSNAVHDEPEVTPTEKVITIRIQESTNSMVEDAARATGLKRSDVLRLAIERGVDVLLQQLNTPVAQAPRQRAAANGEAMSPIYFQSLRSGVIWRFSDTGTHLRAAGSWEWMPGTCGIEDMADDADKVEITTAEGEPS